VQSEDGPVQIMHNGLRVVAGGYHGAWMSEIIAQLGGHHEPQEERAFATLLDMVGPDACMIELGCFWSYYSLWFLKGHPGRKALGIEPDPAHVEIGRRNAALNGLHHEIRQGVIGAEDRDHVVFETEDSGTVSVPMFRASTLCRDFARGRVDILHCDTQGAETIVVADCEALLRSGQVRFLVISTHDQSITGDCLTHQRCLAMVRDFGGLVLEEHDVHESFSGDGLIVAYFGQEPIKWPELSLSFNRYSHSLFPNPIFRLAAAHERVTEGTAAQGPPAVQDSGTGPPDPEDALNGRDSGVWHRLARFFRTDR
jgi:FkbM family methyltransferase